MLLAGAPRARACPPGQEASDDTDGHCCWPGQAWLRSAARCTGTPRRCPPDSAVVGDQCVARRTPEKAKSAKPRVAGCPTGMALVKGGLLADDDGQTKVGDVCVDATEVTASQYQECMEEGKCSDGDHAGACTLGSAFYRDHPVNCVDWFQAGAYCKWVGKRLPTEDEWEWTARGGDRGARFPWGETLDRDRTPTGTVCWRGVVCHTPTGRDEHERTCPVGTHHAGDTPLGIADLAGNVSEWTSSGDDAERAVRGGSYLSAHPTQLETGSRESLRPRTRRSATGFRCAMTPLRE